MFSTKHGARGLEVLGLFIDDDASQIPSFASNYGARFPVAWDADHKIASCWQPPSVPTIYVIDKQGVVKHIHRGWHDGEEKEIGPEIERLLGEPF